ncbi:MAG: hypothetical protein Q9P14_04670 [candidate division KSB1 bacterium]|nr:hypothetical protein [candidate division KSB1 bacterium]MDQ7065547.1 hypothetical protein [candidate division KSB1 bacterium]
MIKIKNTKQKMQLVIDIPEKDLIEFGKKTIEEEFQRTLQWLKIRNSFEILAHKLQQYDQKDYCETLEAIREDAWLEYKKELNL